jgi:hypothetical protein
MEIPGLPRPLRITLTLAELSGVGIAANQAARNRLADTAC